MYYTLDGSIPNEESMLYQGEEIMVSDRTMESNAYTDVWCTPVDFWAGDGNSYTQHPQYKATVVKARLYFPEELLFDQQTGNYSKDAKVFGYLEYFENGKKVMENEVTLRICGAASRGNVQKSLAVYAWGEGDKGVFKYPVFGADKANTFSSLRLRAFGNDWRRSMFRDALSQKRVEGLKLGMQACQPCILLVNGEYFYSSID